MFKVVSGIGAVCVIGYFGWIAYIVFCPDIENYRNRTEFNSELWKEWEETEETASLRWDMTHSLTSKHELMAMSTDQVIELLGKPSGESSSELRYYLGMSRHGIDAGSLVLELQDGRVIGYRIWHG